MVPSSFGDYGGGTDDDDQQQNGPRNHTHDKHCNNNTCASHTSSALSKHWGHMKRFYPKSNLHGYDRDCDVHIDKPTFILKVIFFVLDLIVDIIG